MNGFLPLSDEDKQRWTGNTIIPYVTPDGYLLCDIEDDISDEVLQNYFTGKIRYAVYANKTENVVFLLIKVGNLAWYGFPVFMEAKRKIADNKKNKIIIKLLLQERDNKMPSSYQKYTLPDTKQEFLEICAEIIEELSENDYLDRCRKVASELDDTSLAMEGIIQETEFFQNKK